MIIRVRARVTARAKENSLVRESSGALRIRVTAAPNAGAANERVIELVADEFRVPKTNVTIIQGFKAKDKLLEIQM